MVVGGGTAAWPHEVAAAAEVKVKVEVEVKVESRALTSALSSQFRACAHAHEPNGQQGKSTRAAPARVRRPPLRPPQALHLASEHVAPQIEYTHTCALDHLTLTRVRALEGVALLVVNLQSTRVHTMKYAYYVHSAEAEHTYSYQ